jgi:hypothetical protein
MSLPKNILANNLPILMDHVYLIVYHLSPFQFWLVHSSVLILSHLFSFFTFIFPHRHPSDIALQLQLLDETKGFFWFDIIQWLGRCQLLLYIYIEYIVIIWFIWLVGLTILKNISQWEGLSHILWTKNMFQSTNQIHIYIYIYIYIISAFGENSLFFLMLWIFDMRSWNHVQIWKAYHGSELECNAFVIGIRMYWLVEEGGRMGSHNGLICTNPKLGM